MGPSGPWTCLGALSILDPGPWDPGSQSGENVHEYVAVYMGHRGIHGIHGVHGGTHGGVHGGYTQEVYPWEM